MNRRVAVLLGAALAAAAFGREPAFVEFRAVQESLARVPPRLRASWLHEHGLELPGYNAPRPAVDQPESSGLSLVGKLGRGPAFEVTGRDTLVFLSLGSEVAVFSFADPDEPRLLSEVQAMGFVLQTAVRDSFLYIGCNTGITGVEVWNIHDPATPVFRSRCLSMMSDFCIGDSFLYLTQDGLSADTFKVYSVTDSGSPQLLGMCRDSGSAVTVANGTAFLSDRWGLYAIDVSNPAAPHRIGSWGSDIISATARNNICCVTTGNPNEPDYVRFTVLDITNPASPVQLGYLDSCGGYDIHLADSIAFVSGYYTGGHGFQIVSIRDSTHPTMLGSCPTEDVGFGVWANPAAHRAYVAGFVSGLDVMDILSYHAPIIDTVCLAAGYAYDVCVKDTLMFVASDGCGLAVADVSDPTTPRQIGQLDSTRQTHCQAVAVEDSFAFMPWWWPDDFLSVDVSRPSLPARAGGCQLANPAEAMQLRDTLAYIAEDYRFQVVNVANPRAPVVVGTCVLPNVGLGVALRDTLAFVTSWPSQVINVSNPTAPVVIGAIPIGNYDMAVDDTFAFVPAPYDSMVVYDIAVPSAPVRVASLRFSGGHVSNGGVALVDSLLYSGGDIIHVVNVANPLEPREIGSWTPPDWAVRLGYFPPFLYASCYDAGVCILETESTGVAERPPGPGAPGGLRLCGNIVRDAVLLTGPDLNGKEVMITTYNSAGRLVEACALRGSGAQVRYSFARMPAGVYVLRAQTAGRTHTFKVVKL